jgi:hypothetical protein
VSLEAQETRLMASGAPAAELPFEFTQVSEMFELRDGRVLVLDRLQGEVRLADLRTGRQQLMGRIGDGPREYRAALELVPLGGDSVGVYDDANVRILIVTGAGTLGGFVSPFSSADGTRIGGFVGDGSGWIYGEQRARSSDDSASIFRWRAGEPVAKLVTRIHRPLPDGAVAMGQGTVRPGSFARPDTRNLWAVGVDGRVAVAVFRPYHVLFTSRSGEKVVGPEIAFRRLEMNDSLKTAFLGEREKAVTGEIFNPATGQKTILREPVFPVDPSTITWARELPPFRGNAFIAFAPDGKLWIQRTTFGREGARYDIVDREGKLVDRVHLPEGHRVVGFGRNEMYVVRRDANDLAFLQQRPLPR